MSEDVYQDSKLYSLKFGQICSTDDKFFSTWKSNLAESLWREHIEETKGMDIVEYVNKFRLRPLGHSIEDICAIWELPWPLIKEMVDDGRLNAFIDISCWLDNDGELFRKPSGVYIRDESINAFENANTILRERHVKLII
ncbi:hypothetical protein [Solidesulfovibrio alcoholivorans]|uniref:hypothetical protein n=1 Tax=Solidesulfovibrio alcoholivorans TaxID=81406 RepID=UPI0012EC7DC2|nr:hypothetical protein [Solidesulfovibrio alcoholivorans]